MEATKMATKERPSQSNAGSEPVSSAGWANALANPLTAAFAIGAYNLKLTSQAMKFWTDAFSGFYPSTLPAPKTERPTEGKVAAKIIPLRKAPVSEVVISPIQVESPRADVATVPYLTPSAEMTPPPAQTVSATEPESAVVDRGEVSPSLFDAPAALVLDHTAEPALPKRPGGSTKLEIAEAGADMLPFPVAKGQAAPAPKLRMMRKQAGKTAVSADANAVAESGKAVKPASAEAPADGGQTARAADDLKAISGIGPKLEHVLNGEGVLTYAQIAAWTPDEVARFEKLLGFNGRISRDGWVRQASDFVAKAGG